MNDDTRRPRRGRGLAVLAAVVATAAVAVPASASLVDDGGGGVAASGSPDAPAYLPVQDGEATPAPDENGQDGGSDGRGPCPEKDGEAQDESSSAAPSPQGSAEL